MQLQQILHCVLVFFLLYLTAFPGIDHRYKQREGLMNQRQTGKGGGKNMLEISTKTLELYIDLILLRILRSIY